MQAFVFPRIQNIETRFSVFHDPGVTDLTARLCVKRRFIEEHLDFFGTPLNDTRFLPERMPVWVDRGTRNFYGIPGNEFRGFKVADNAPGIPFDPTSGERLPTPEGLRAARDYLGFRFPEMSGAPLLESRVCQYENSPKRRFLIDRHPRAENVWLVGGGSGHGFKHCG